MLPQLPHRSELLGLPQPCPQLSGAQPRQREFKRVRSAERWERDRRNGAGAIAILRTAVTLENRWCDFLGFASAPAKGIDCQLQDSAVARGIGSRAWRQ